MLEGRQTKQARIAIIIYLAQDWISYSARVKGYFTEVPLIRALAKLPEIRLLCINRPITPVETMLRKPRKIMAWLRGELGLRKIDESLYLYAPFAFLHDRIALYIPLMEQLNRMILSYQVKKQLRKLGWHSSVKISWIYHPLQYNYLRLAGEDLKVYECYSPYSLRVSSRRLADKISFYEDKTLLACDTVFCFDSILLYRRQARINRNTHFMLAGVEFGHFEKALDKDTLIPDELAQVNAPRIGFVGTISELVDIELINLLAERHPEWSLVLIGNVSSDKQLTSSEAYQHSQSLHNVHYLGFKKYEDLPAYNKYLDVCLLPYRKVEAMNYILPHKTFQYLAAGKPVVSTDIPDVRLFKDVVRIAKTYEEFSAMVEEALSDNSQQSIERRVEVARQNTWEDRAKTIYEIICSKVAERQKDRNG